MSSNKPPSVKELRSTKRQLEGTRSYASSSIASDQDRRKRAGAGRSGTASVRSGRAPSVSSVNSQKSVIMRRVGTVLGQYVASPVVESMDMNAIMDEVDWNEVLDKVDWNEVVFDKIDFDRHLDRIDVNRLLDRVDINQHLDKVDWNAIIERSNLAKIVERSTSGVLSGMSGLMRTRLAWIDQWIQRFGRCYCCGKNKGKPDFLPPRPGRPEDSETVWENPEKLNKQEFEKAIMFRTCGATSRLLYVLLDQAIVWTVYATFAAIVLKLTEIFSNDPELWDTLSLVQTFWFEGLLYVICYATYWIFLVGCLGRTIGMWMLGLMMVSREGNRVTFLKTCYQVIFIPLNVFFFGWILGFTRRDGASASDIVGGVLVVYVWDVRDTREVLESLPGYETKPLLVPDTLDVNFGGDKGDGLSRIHDDFDSDSDSYNDAVEMTNLEDGASQWSTSNM